MKILGTLIFIILCYYGGQYAASNNLSLSDMLVGATLFSINFLIWTCFFCFYFSNILGCLLGLPVVIYKCLFKKLPFVRILMCIIPLVFWNMILLAIPFTAGYFELNWLLKSMDTLSFVLAFWLALAQILSVFFRPTERTILYEEMKRLWSVD